MIGRTWSHQRPSAGKLQLAPASKAASMQRRCRHPCRSSIYPVMLAARRPCRTRASGPKRTQR
eukprot:10749041-Alexandrium_andersonii.AAC.1